MLRSWSSSIFPRMSCALDTLSLWMKAHETWLYAWGNTKHHKFIGIWDKFITFNQNSSQKPFPPNQLMNSTSPVVMNEGAFFSQTKHKTYHVKSGHSLAIYEQYMNVATSAIWHLVNEKKQVPHSIGWNLNQ